MMKKKTFFVLLGMLLLSPLMLHAKSSPFVEDGIEYESYDNYKIRVSGLADKSLTNIVIPARRQYPLVVWRNVICIDTEAFKNETSIVSVTLPNTIENIGSSAFRNCTALTSINIPENLTINSWAFAGCTALVTLDVPNNVTYIGANAFKDVFNVVYNGTATGAPWGAKHLNAYVEGYIAYETSAKTKIIGCHPSCAGQVVIPNSVTEIASNAFEGCTKITAITIPSSVKTIGARAFANTGISSITIPAGATSVGNDICNGCTSLRTVVWNVKSHTDFTSSARPFLGVASQITSFTFGSNVETIPAYLCYTMSGLTTITLPGSVKAIGNYAFSGCSGISAITIPNGVTTIEARAFQGCSKLTSITIPSSVTKMGNNVFNSCDALKTVVWNVKSGADYFMSSSAPFYGVRITSFTFGSNVETIPAYLCYDMDKLTNITLPASVTAIGKSAFSYCSALTAITSEATTAPTCGTSVFQGVSKSIPVNIPCGSLDSYKAATIWKDFTNLTEPYVYAFELQTADAAMGSVQFDQPFTCASKVAYFSAVPAEHYHFTQWSDGNTDNPRIVTVSADSTLTAQFAPNQYTLTVLSDNEEQGTVSGGTTADYLTEIIITAVPAAGYKFLQWNDDNTDNPRTVTLTEDATYTAFFMKDETTGIGQTTNGPAAEKIIRNGQVLILRGGKVYTLTGEEVYL